MKFLCSAFFTIFSCIAFGQDLIMQNGTFTQCSGVLLDSGSNLTYSSDENYTLTICPQNANQSTQLNFTSFSTEANTDVLTIFNGQSTSDPVIGTYSGTVNIGIVQASNISGCLTLQFVSNGSIDADGWSANISCNTSPCQTIVSQIDTADPAPNTDGYILACLDEEITISGSGQFSNSSLGATYEWDLGDGRTLSGQTAKFSYDKPGVYFVNLNIIDSNSTGDPIVCKNINALNQVIQVAPPSDLTKTSAAALTLCYGESTTIEGVAEAVPYFSECTPPMSEETFLPDGSGSVYETSITVDCFNSNQTLDNINQLTEICLVMEHSFLGDLTIEIISPSGQSVRLHDREGESANLGIPWATGPLDEKSNNLTAGQGYNYCFVPGNTFPTLAAGILPNGTFPSENGPDTYRDFFVPSGNYSPVSPLNRLLGSPLNGDWTIRVTDNAVQDNGYIFSWELNFDPALQPSTLSFTPTLSSQMWDPDSSIINTSADTITVQPPTDGTFCYTYRVVNDFGCENIAEICVEVLPELIYATPKNLFGCVTPGSSSYVFDLNQNNAIIFAPTPNASDFVLTYHRSQNAADFDLDPISPAEASAFTGIKDQIIYARFEYKNSGCYETVSFVLNIFDQPSILSVGDYKLCDNALDGNDSNGVVEFDLSTKVFDVLGSQSASDFAVKFYYDQPSADAGVLGTDITTVVQNTSNPQQLFARIENKLNTNCFETTSFQLIVNPLPEVDYEVSLKQCDTDTDGITDFNLIEANPLISANYINETFTYYRTEAKANSGLLGDQITTPTAYANPTSLNSVIYARVETVYGCFRISKVNLVVGATLIPSSFQLDYFVCDNTAADNDNSNGIATFDFSDATAKILAIFPAGQDLKVTYYTSESDALAELNSIPDVSNHRNIGSPSVQKIFARVDSNDVNACLGLGHHITLNVEDLPQKNRVKDYKLCSDTNQASFDLTTKTSEIQGSQVTPILISYHLSEQDAENNIPISSDLTTYTNTSNPQTIYVRAQFDPNNNMNLDARECVRTDIRFDLIVNLNPVLVIPKPISLCSDQITTLYDLTLRKDEITANDPTIVLSYFESQTDLDMNNPIVDPTAYNNTVLSKTIIILAKGANQCTSTTQLKLNTILYAALNIMPAPIEECEIDNDGFHIFDIREIETAILNGLKAKDFEFRYYENEIDALAGNTDTILNPTNFENKTKLTQEIYVRVKPLTNACFVIIPLTLIVNPVPEIQLSERYVLCLDKNDQTITAINDAFLPNPPLDTQLNTIEYSFQWYMGSIEEVNTDPNTVIIPGATEATFFPNLAGIYTVMVTNRTSGCSLPSSTEVVSSYPPENIDVTLLSEVFSDQNTIEVVVTGKGKYEYRVDYGPWQKETVFTNVGIGEHLIYVRDLLNCNTISQKKTVIGFSKYFTPNGDGYHDTWNIVGITKKLNVKIYIFDRFGNLLKQLSPTAQGWDGSFNGTPLPASDYWFRIDYTEPITGKTNTFRSHFTLKR